MLVTYLYVEALDLNSSQMYMKFSNHFGFAKVSNKWILKQHSSLKLPILFPGTSELLKTNFYKFLLMALTKKLNIFSLENI